MRITKPLTQAQTAVKEYKASKGEDDLLSNVPFARTLIVMKPLLVKAK